eukprot:s202_g15.t1
MVESCCCSRLGRSKADMNMQVSRSVVSGEHLAASDNSCRFVIAFLFCPSYFAHMMWLIWRATYKKG